MKQSVRVFLLVSLFGMASSVIAHTHKFWNYGPRTVYVKINETWCSDDNVEVPPARGDVAGYKEVSVGGCCSKRYEISDSQGYWPGHSPDDDDIRGSGCWGNEVKLFANRTVSIR